MLAEFTTEIVVPLTVISICLMVAGIFAMTFVLMAKMIYNEIFPNKRNK